MLQPETRKWWTATCAKFCMLGGKPPDGSGHFEGNSSSRVLALRVLEFDNIDRADRLQLAARKRFLNVN